MRADAIKKIDDAIQALQELRELTPEILSSPEREELLWIADRLDDHIDRGVPYSLTFFYSSEVPLTGAQKKILEGYLAYRFRDIWGKSWIKGDAQKIRDIAQGEGGEG